MVTKELTSRKPEEQKSNQGSKTTRNKSRNKPSFIKRFGAIAALVLAETISGCDPCVKEPPESEHCVSNGTCGPHLIDPSDCSTLAGLIDTFNLDEVELEATLFSSLGRYDAAARDYAFLAKMYYFRCEYDRSLEFYSLALNAAEESTEQTHDLAHALYNIGSYLNLIGDQAQAEGFLNRSMFLAIGINNDLVLAEISIELARIYHCRGNTDSAKGYEEVAEAVAEDLALTVIPENLDIAARMYRELAALSKSVSNFETAGRRYERVAELGYNIDLPVGFDQLYVSNIRITAAQAYCCSGLPCEAERMFEEMRADGHQANLTDLLSIIRIEEIGCRTGYLRE